MDEFRLLTVREIDTSLDPDPYGLMYPLPAARKDDVLLESRDGDNVHRYPVKAVATYLMRPGGAFAPLSGNLALPFSLIVTDARLVFACSQFDPGSTWIGTPGVLNLALNAMSSASAARRRRGKMLVGQIRYPWLGAVAARRKQGFMGDEHLILIIPLPSRDLLKVYLVPNRIDALALGASILRRSAKYNLACGFDAALRHRDSLEEISSVRTLPDGGKKFSSMTIPSAQWAEEASARLSPPSVPW